MANFSRGNSMDYSSKFGPQQRDEWGRKKPQKLNSGSRHAVSQNVLIEPYDTFSSQLPCNSFSQFQNDFGLSNFESSSKCDDSEILTALVNKILEDDGDKYAFKEGDSQFPELLWNSESESIGQLAIKLADLNMLEHEIKTVPERSLKQELSFHNGGKFYDEHGASQPFWKEPSMKTSHNEFSAVKSAPANIMFKSDKPTIPRTKNDLIIKKKKFTSWNWYSQNQNNFKDTRKATNQDGYGLKHGLRNIPPSSSAPQAFIPQTAGRKSKNAFMKHSGSPLWMQCASNDSSKSESSSSSNSSVYKDHTSHASTDSFNCKEVSEFNDSRKGPFPSRQPRKFRKAYSTGSSSSAGKSPECVFCKTNGETSAIYRGHVLKDDEGRTVCRVLQQYICPLCGATGYNAHTVKYCPKNENPPPIATMTTLKSMRSSTGRRRQGPCSGQIRPISFGFNRNPLPA